MTDSYDKTCLTLAVILSLILSIFAYAKFAIADDIPGLSALASAGKKFPCKQILRYHGKESHPYHGTMLNTFGTRRRCWKRYLTQSANKAHTLQIYLSNEVCRKKGNCERYELLPRLSIAQYNRKLENRNPRVKRKVIMWMREAHDFCRISGNSKTECLLANGLEHQFSFGAVRTLVSWANEVGWKKKQLVSNPMGANTFQGLGGNHYMERHGLHPFYGLIPEGRRIATLDGVRASACFDRRTPHEAYASDADLRKWHNTYKNGARFHSYWCGEWQGLSGQSSGSAPGPRARDFRVRAATMDRLFGIAK